MIPNPFGRRRAERFAQLLDEAAGGRRHHTRTPYDDDIAELVAVAEQVRQRLSRVAEDIAVDDAYRNRLRQRLLAVAQTQGIGDSAADSESEPVYHEHPVGARRRTKLAIAAGATIGILALSGVSTASGDSVPGEALYPVKRHTERAQLALAGSDLNRGRLYLSFAETRLKEAAAVTDDLEAFSAALDDMDSDTRMGVKLLHTAAVERQDAEVLNIVENFVVEHRRSVVDLITELDGKARERALSSLDLLDASAERAAALRQSLVCTAQTGTAEDNLGPIPQRCSAAPEPDQPAVDPDVSGTTAPGQTRSGRESTSAGGVATTPGEASPSAEPSEEPELPDDDAEEPGADSASPDRRTGISLLDELGRLIGELLGR